MSRYIDADAFEKRMEHMCDFICEYPKKQRHIMCNGCNLGVALHIFESMPTADVVEVVHGEWISLHNGYYKCSHCGMSWKLVGSPELNGMYYCLNCGAKMEVEDEQIH